MPRKNGDNTMRRAYVLGVEGKYLSKQMEALALIIQGRSYNNGFDAGFDYAATGAAKTETNTDTGETLRTLGPTEHILTSDHNGEPVCGCGYDPAAEGALDRRDAINMVRLHRHEIRAAA